MTLAKCFTNVFDSFMKSEGFLRKGKLYYRVMGDILQGVVLKSTKSYSVCYTYFPYWAYSFQNILYSKDEIDKGFWAEIGEEVNGNRCEKTITEADQQVMQDIFSIFQATIIPKLNRICDINSYWLAVVNSRRDYLERAIEFRNVNMYDYMQSRHINGCIHPNAYALLYKACLDQSYDESDQIVAQIMEIEEKRERMVRGMAKKTTKEIEQLIDDHIELLKETCPDLSILEMRRQAEQIWMPRDDADDEKLATAMRKFRSFHFSVYDQQKSIPDFSMIEKLFATESVEMKAVLANYLKLNI